MCPKCKVLVIDDQQDICRLFARTLSEEGYEVVTADSEQKMKIALAKDNSIKIVILDILFPYSSGVELFKYIKDNYPQLAVIISSIYPESDQDFLITQAQDYYCKSESTDFLIKKVDNIFKTKFSYGR
jgi:DNA-binding NtrC family response regulator